MPKRCEGDLLQYSSGTTGRPKVIRLDLMHLSPAKAPNMLMPLLTAVGLTGDAIYLSPAALYHTAPSLWSMSVQSLGGNTVVMENSTPSLDSPDDPEFVATVKRLHQRERGDNDV
jgi:long-chain acyl-CoA synthetase